MTEQFTVPASASHPSTNQAVYDLVAPLARPNTRLLDFGAGRGHMAARIASRFAAQGVDPSDALVACDLDAKSFAVDGLECQPIAWDGHLPWPDDTFDAAYSVEVIEHLENPYAFARELMRVLKPGGTAVLTTPNIHNMTARFDNLLRGYPTMFGLVSFRPGDEGTWLGHVTPIVWTTLYAALRAGGAKQARLHIDRRKRSAKVLATLTFPWIKLSVARYRRHLASANPARREAERNLGDALSQMSAFDLLTSRSLVVEALKAG